MKRNLMPLLAVAFVSAVVATGIFYGLLLTRLRQPQDAAGGRRVVIAKKTLDRGTVLRAEDLKETNWRGAAPPGAVTAVEQATGLTALEPLGANQPLLAAQLTPRGLAGGASLAIPPGMRAVSIHPADSGGVVAMLRSGSRVDIQVIEGMRGAGQKQLRRMFENVEVLSVGGVEGASANRPVVTLLVNPADADRLSLADAGMLVRLVLRNPSDVVTTASAAAGMKTR